jgi:hypothetical protein
MTTVKLKIARERGLERIRYLKLYFITTKLIQIVNQIKG